MVRQSQLARVSLVEIKGTVDSLDAKKSRMTGRIYTYRKRNSISMPFGQSSTHEDYYSAKQAIALALKSETEKRATYFKAQGNLDVSISAAT